MHHEFLPSCLFINLTGTSLIGDGHPPIKRRKTGPKVDREKAVPHNPATYTLDPRCTRCENAQTECVFYISPTKARKKNITCVRCKSQHKGCQFKDYPPTKVHTTVTPIPLSQSPSTSVMSLSDTGYTLYAAHSNVGSSSAAAPGGSVFVAAVPGASPSTQANETLHSNEALRLQRDFDRLERTMVDGLQALTNFVLENMGRKPADEQRGENSRK